jgi:2-polyprenyl-6-hydroxyphenyl methylase/3-demethylubiquinone-9 3-methyltransferase
VAEDFDVVVFTEILEHITFTPVLFWRRIYKLLKVGGSIYLTTPNALTPWKMLHVVKRLVTQNGVGITTPEIFHTVTFGHHWKEFHRVILAG